MHNWLEGVLEHQLRILWGIGRHTQQAKALAELDADDGDLWTDDDISEAGAQDDAQDSDDDDEEEEDDEEDDTPKGTPAPNFDDPMDGSGSTPVPESLASDESDSDDENNDEEFEDVAVRGSWKFTPERLEKIRSCIREVSLPTWVHRPPGNLGEKTHGKLKAEEFLTLFSVIFPLVLPEMQLDDDPIRHEAMFKSFCHLVAATNIVSSFKNSNSAADAFTNHYAYYFESIKTLFPDVNTKPNHHYAWHDADILKNWGPLASQNKFMGERINGMLQKIKTNDHFYDMDYTMLRQMARLGRLFAQQHDLEENKHDTRAPELRELDNILEPEDPVKAVKPKTMDEAELTEFLANKKHEISSHVYNLILNYLASVGEHIQFYKPGTEATQNSTATGHRPLSVPTYSESTELMSALVYAKPDPVPVVIEPKHIVTHVTTWERSAQIHKTPEPVLAICWALNRGRR
ncbi:hypothetical protein C8J57DRAFT_1537022 [Mycena rebaudengoi]|nr:hypothetical protein C8J57DRAFT_1537022 [Mycena rebaudengoi]